MSDKLREEVKRIGYNTKEATKVEIKKYQCPYIMDHWTGPNNETYTTLTGHFIDNKWSLCSCVFVYFMEVQVENELG
jgi:hypothetical protein